jgi:hypothetical protein
MSDELTPKPAPVKRTTTKKATPAPAPVAGERGKPYLTHNGNERIDH